MEGRGEEGATKKDNHGSKTLCALPPPPPPRPQDRVKRFAPTFKGGNLSCPCSVWLKLEEVMSKLPHNFLCHPSSMLTRFPPPPPPPPPFPTIWGTENVIMGLPLFEIIGSAPAPPPPPPPPYRGGSSGRGRRRPEGFSIQFPLVSQTF